MHIKSRACSLSLLRHGGCPQDLYLPLLRKGRTFRHLLDEVKVQMTCYLPTYPVPLTVEKEYHVTFIYHKSSVELVRKLCLKFEQKENLVCFFHDRDSLPGTKKPWVDSTGGFFKKSMNIIIVLNKKFLEDCTCQKLLSLAMTQSVCRYSNVIPIVLDDCSIPLILSDRICLDVQGNERVWWTRLLEAIKLDNTSSEETVDVLEDAAQNIIQTFESESLEDVLPSFSHPMAKSIDFFLRQGQSSKIDQCLNFLAAKKWFQVLFLYHPSNSSTITKIIKRQFDANSTYQCNTHTELCPVFAMQENIDCCVSNSLVICDVNTTEEMFISHRTLLDHNNSPPIWTRAVNIVVVLSTDSTRDASFMRRLEQIVNISDNARDRVRIIPLKVDNCEIPFYLQDIFHADIQDDECTEKLFRAINICDSYRFTKKISNSGKIENSYESLSNALKKMTYKQLSEFLCRPVALELRHYFSQFGHVRYWLEAVEWCGITLSQSCVVIRTEILMEHLKLGHNVRKYYDSCHSFFNSHDIVIPERLNAIKGKNESNTLIIENYGKQMCDSFVIGISLQYVYELYFESNSKSSYDMIHQWVKDTGYELNTYSISFFRSGQLKKQKKLPSECGEFLLPITHNLHLIESNNFCFVNYIPSRKGRIKFSLLRDNVTFYIDKVEMLHNNTAKAQYTDVCQVFKEMSKQTAFHIVEWLPTENHLEFLLKKVALLEKDVESICNDSFYIITLLRNDIRLLKRYSKSLRECKAAYLFTNSLNKEIMLLQYHIASLRNFVHSLHVNDDRTRHFKVTLHM